ncbi:hypothetical protein C4J65_09850 [Streptomyces sp. CB09001]|uniref:hypothetical protein n=1 Tax=Streptomyces sp. CB09001 TaxID=2083284 RepID=UPI000E2128C0|nr:hypothetical protein [Streptomyces sp. CB09001]AXL88597.1 hypothetical protein C4J65_09850 [Streptomyces sp. CB09001]
MAGEAAAETRPEPGEDVAGRGQEAAGTGLDVAGTGLDVGGTGLDVAGHRRDVAGIGPGPWRGCGGGAAWMRWGPWLLSAA